MWKTPHPQTYFCTTTCRSQTVLTYKASFSMPQETLSFQSAPSEMFALTQRRHSPRAAVCYKSPQTSSVSEQRTRQSAQSRWLRLSKLSLRRDSISDNISVHRHLPEPRQKTSGNSQMIWRAESGTRALETAILSRACLWDFPFL